MIAALSSIVSAFLWRFKGMSHSWGTTANRLIWVSFASLVMFRYAWLHTYPLWLVLLSSGLIWGSISIGHSKWQDDNIRSYWGMCWITWVRLTAMLAPFMWYNPELILLTVFSLLAWPACWLGYKFDDYGLKLSTFGFVWCDPVKGSEWEELFIGLLPYGAVFMILMS